MKFVLLLIQVVLILVIAAVLWQIWRFLKRKDIPEDGPLGEDDHDAAARELFEHKSLDALAYLIEQGRELEFSWNGKMCFLSRSGSTQYVSLWYHNVQQSFDSIPLLIENAMLDSVPFRSAWENAELLFLF